MGGLLRAETVQCKLRVSPCWRECGEDVGLDGPQRTPENKHSKTVPGQVPRRKDVLGLWDTRAVGYKFIKVSETRS